MVAIESRLNSGFIAVDDGISNGNSVGVIIQSRLQKAAEKALMECQDSYLKARQKTVETIFFHSFSEFRKIQVTLHDTFWRIFFIIFIGYISNGKD